MPQVSLRHSAPWMGASLLLSLSSQFCLKFDEYQDKLPPWSFCYRQNSVRWLPWAQKAAQSLSVSVKAVFYFSPPPFFFLPTLGDGEGKLRSDSLFLLELFKCSFVWRLEILVTFLWSHWVVLNPCVECISLGDSFSWSTALLLQSCLIRLLYSVRWRFVSYTVFFWMKV